MSGGRPAAGRTALPPDRAVTACIDEFARQLAGRAAPDRVWVALSGGLDSMVLAHALVSRVRERPVHAVHVNHHLEPAADHWAGFCGEICARLGLPLTVLEVAVDRGSGQGIEAAARAARYRAVAGLVGPGDWLCTAHHRNDQAETVLMRLVRGAGLPYLAGMAASSRVFGVEVRRPLLQLGREDLAGYARFHGIEYVDDPGNDALVNDRSFLRHRVLAELERRWPGAAERIARTSIHLQGAARVLEESAVADIGRCQVAGTRTGGLPRLAALDTGQIALLPRYRRENLLHHWLRAHCGAVPGRARFERIMALAGPASAGRVDLGPRFVYRYRDRLVLSRQFPPWRRRLQWDPGSTAIEHGPFVLRLQAVAAGGLDIGRVDAEGGVLILAPRRGGESLRPGQSGPSRTVKNLLQEAGIASYERQAIPLVWVGDEVVQVPGVCTTHRWSAVPGKRGYQFVFCSPDTIDSVPAVCKETHESD